MLDVNRHVQELRTRISAFRGDDVANIQPEYANVQCGGVV